MFKKISDCIDNVTMFMIGTVYMICLWALVGIGIYYLMRYICLI